MSTTTDLAIRDDQTTFDDFQVAALRQIGVQNASNADLAVFFHTCKRTGLDPFARQVYMIARGGKQTMQTGIDGLRLVAQRTAERTRETFGYEDTMWADDAGVWHDMWLGEGKPAAAKVTVVRNGQRFPAVAMYREYAQTSPNWREKPALMLAKCAEAAALRKAFPMDLSGIYTPDELAPDAPARAARPAGMDAVRAAVAPEQPVDDVEDADVVDEGTGEVQPITAKTRGALFALMGEMQVGDDDAQRRFLSDTLGHEVTSRANLTEAEGLLAGRRLRAWEAGDETAAWVDPETTA